MKAEGIVKAVAVLTSLSLTVLLMFPNSLPTSPSFLSSQPTNALPPSASPWPSETPSPSPPPLKPALDLKTLLADTPPSKTKCKFNGCPATADSPYIYLFTPFRNRAANYHRLVRTLVEDVTGGRRAVDPRCVCLAIANFDDVLSGVPLSRAVEPWPFDVEVLSMKGGFSPAGGFEAVVQKVVKTPYDKSLIFRIDADMVVYPGFLARVLKNTKLGSRAYAPACWNQHNNETDWYSGNWRVTGSGMIGFYMEDFKAVTKGTMEMPLNDKNTYGLEDHLLMMMMAKTLPTYTVKRDCCNELWHMYHPHSKWERSANGLVDQFHTPGVDDGKSTKWHMELPKKDGAEYLQTKGMVYRNRCHQFHVKLYPA